MLTLLFAAPFPDVARFTHAVPITASSLRIAYPICVKMIISGQDNGVKRARCRTLTGKLS